MKKILTLILGLLLAGCTTPKQIAPAVPINSALARREIGGTWQIENGFVVFSAQGEFTFLPDGTFTSGGKMRLLFMHMAIQVEGKWRIEDGVLVEEVTKSSNPKMVALGLLTRDRIITINEHELVTQTESGEIESYRRAKAK